MKLLVDAKAGRVLYADAGKDVADFIASIATLPPATVASLVGRDAMPGALGTICGSVIDNNNLATQALLSPPAGGGEVLYQLLGSLSEEAAGGVGFVRGGATEMYTVMDDLQVAPMLSAVSGATMLNSQQGVTDTAALQEKTVQLGSNEALEILRVAQKSKTVLTDVFLGAAALEPKKSAAYPHLWSEVLALEARSPGLSLKASFLKLDDATATALNDSLKKQMLEELNVMIDEQDIKAEVCAALADSIAAQMV
ncbi:unnamed protein product [Urochloa humidicola]